jgi:hypothetical protein
MSLPIFDRPSLFYGWAERNTRPQVKSDERRKRNKLNGLKSVDAVSGEEFFRLSPGSKTEDVSEYLAELCLDCVELGYDQLCIILDNNPTHKQSYAISISFASSTDGTGALDYGGISLSSPLFSEVKPSRVCNSSATLAVSTSSPDGGNIVTD